MTRSRTSVSEYGVDLNLLLTKLLNKHSHWTVTWSQLLNVGVERLVRMLGQRHLATEKQRW